MATLSGRTHRTGYHIRGGMHLDYIWDHPDDTTYTNTYGNYVNALPSNEWDFVTMQPFYKAESTLGQDENRIIDFIDLTRSGPSLSTRFFIYSAWPSSPETYQTTWTQAVSNDPDQSTVHSRDYFTYLYDNVTDHYGDDVELFVIPIGEVMFKLDQEFRAGRFAGYDDISDLYRDQVHLSNDVGRFVAATTTFATLFREDPTGLERPAGFYPYPSGPSAITDELRIFLQEIVWEVVSQHPDSGVDARPDGFIFSDVIDVAVDDDILSNEIVVSGVNVATEVTIENGAFSINGSPYSSEPAMVEDGDRVRVMIRSSSDYSTIVSSLLVIGGMSDTFSAMTIDEPVSPAVITPQDNDQDDTETADVAVTESSAALDGLSIVVLLSLIAISRRFYQV